MSELLQTVFNYNAKNKAMEVVMINDEHYFVASDICKILCLDSVSKAIEKLEDDEKLVGKIYRSGQNREMSLVNESGLYNLIFRSNKPEAKAFRKWVTSEVLPNIRKTGSYQIVKHNEKLIELINKSVQLVGSYNKLAAMMGISNATLSNLVNHKHSSFTAELLNRIDVFCEHLLNKGIGYDREITDMLMGIDNKALRQKLFKKFKDGGML